MSIKLPLRTWVVIVGALTGNASQVIVGALTGNASDNGAFNVSAETKEEHTERRVSSEFLPRFKECLYYIFDSNIYSQKKKHTKEANKVRKNTETNIKK